MKSIKILITIWMVGLFVGMAQWIYFYTPYTDPMVFRALSTAKMREVMSVIIHKQKISDVLVFLRFIYPVEEPSSHGIGHLLGEELYSTYGARSFGMCDPIFNYGCYHGVVDMAIKRKGLDTALLRQLFDACSRYMTNPAPCIHPLGHASTMLAKYDAVKAFSLCDGLYPDTKVAFSCWNGAMMEYINRNSESSPSDAYGDPNNPYAPCDTFPIQYEASCVSMHISYLSSIWGNDFQRLFLHCKTYKRSETLEHCIDAVGTYVAQEYFFVPDKIILVCKDARPHEDICLMGAVTAFVSANQTQTAATLCKNMKEHDLQRTCYDRTVPKIGP